jgi:hypothetical protein
MGVPRRGVKEYSIGGYVFFYKKVGYVNLNCIFAEKVIWKIILIYMMLVLVV